MIPFGWLHTQDGLPLTALHTVPSGGSGLETRTHASRYSKYTNTESLAMSHSHSATAITISTANKFYSCGWLLTVHFVSSAENYYCSLLRRCGYVVW